MSKLDLSKYGITNTKEIYRNLSYDELYKHETDPSLEGYEKAQETEGARRLRTARRRRIRQAARRRGPAARGCGARRE